MNKAKQPREAGAARGGFKKIVQTLSTVILILCTILCFVVVVRGAMNKETSILGYRLFYVVTGSMEPTLPVNSILLVGQRDTYEPGDIITFYSGDAYIYGQPNTHRIVSKSVENGETLYITQGDANPIPDSDAVPHEDVIGKVCMSFAGGGTVSNIIKTLGTPTGFFAVVLIPILAIALICMRDFKKALTEELRNAAMRSLEEDAAREKEKQEDDKQG